MKSPFAKILALTAAVALFVRENRRRGTIGNGNRLGTVTFRKHRGKPGSAEAFRQGDGRNQHSLLYAQSTTRCSEGGTCKAIRNGGIRLLRDPVALTCYGIIPTRAAPPRTREGAAAGSPRGKTKKKKKKKKKKKARRQDPRGAEGSATICEAPRDAMYRPTYEKRSITLRRHASLRQGPWEKLATATSRRRTKRRFYYALAPDHLGFAKPTETTLPKLKGPRPSWKPDRQYRLATTSGVGALPDPPLRTIAIAEKKGLPPDAIQGCAGRGT